MTAGTGAGLVGSALTIASVGSGSGSGVAGTLGLGVTSCTVGWGVGTAGDAVTLGVGLLGVAEPDVGGAGAAVVAVDKLLGAVSAVVAPVVALPHAVRTVSRPRAARGRKGVRIFMQPTFRAAG